MRLKIGLISLIGIFFTLSVQADFSLDDWQKRVAAENNIDRLGRLYIELMLEEDPTQSSSLGIHGKGDDSGYYDRLLPDATKERSATWEAGRQFLLGKLGKIDAGLQELFSET